MLLLLLLLLLLLALYAYPVLQTFAVKLIVPDPLAIKCHAQA